MDCQRSPGKRYYLTILCCIVTAMLAMIFMGCQEITEPPPSPHLDDANGSMTGAQTVLALPFESGPVVTLTNEYMDPVISPMPGAVMTIPEGIPLTFCWTAERSSDGGAIAGFRYGWDVIDPDNPANWDVDWTPHDGSKVCSASQTFNISSFHFFTVEVIDDAGSSTRITIAIQIRSGPASFDIMPGTCKNPFNTQRKGPVRTVIPGSIGFDVSEIDVSSLYLWIDGNVVEPLRTRTQDITSPMINRDPCDCPPTDTDGIEDLVILFAAADIIRALGSASKDETRKLSLHGILLEGNDFTLANCITIVGNPRTGDDPALFNKDAVLVALQKGYNEKNFQKIGALLDGNFTFFFSEADFQNGDVPYEQWGRDDELTATAKLFNIDDPAGALTVGSISSRFRHVRTSEGASWGRIKALFFDGIIDTQTSIDLLLMFAQGEDKWIAVTPPDPVQYPGEVWYEKTSYYHMIVRAGEFTFITELKRTTFVVRFSETKGHWQLVWWRDDI
jgi:hypothetical protein